MVEEVRPLGAISSDNQEFLLHEQAVSDNGIAGKVAFITRLSKLSFSGNNYECAILRTGQG